MRAEEQVLCRALQAALADASLSVCLPYLVYTTWKEGATVLSGAFPGRLPPCLFLKGGRVEGSSGFVPSEAHRGKDEECKEEGRESKP